MVTTLKVDESILAEPELAAPEPVAAEAVAVAKWLPPEPEPPREGPMEWRYSMPIPGVRYFSFRPATPKPQTPATDRAISAILLDEKVILI